MTDFLALNNLATAFLFEGASLTFGERDLKETSIMPTTVIRTLLQCLCQTLEKVICFLLDGTKMRPAR